jgi:hypothetical protein
VEALRQRPAERPERLQRFVAARVAGDAEMRPVGGLDGDFVALLQAEGLDNGGGKTDGEAIALAADLHATLFRLDILRNCISNQMYGQASPFAAHENWLPRLRRAAIGGSRLWAGGFQMCPAHGATHAVDAGRSQGGGLPPD